MNSYAQGEEFSLSDHSQNENHLYENILESIAVGISEMA